MSAQSIPIVKKDNKVFFHEQAPHNPNVRVVCRVKPLGQFEDGIQMRIDKELSQISISQPRQETTKIFTFNKVFTNQSQRQFVSQVCERVLKEALINKKGYLIFSYGVTNSGKTHTILGSQSQPGILPYLVSKLNQHVEVYLSAIQLYNDQFFALSNKEKLTPKEIGGFLDFQQQYRISEKINSQNMEAKFKQYISNRTQNQTKLNNKSSRSHAIFRIKAGGVVIGVVDLAGSQRTNRVFANIQQTSSINKSLLCLGRCIKALNQNPESQQPIPYRESKLTKVLIEYFAARVQVLMIANINQSLSYFHQNMKVLDYAVLAKDIQHCSSQNSLKKNQFKFSAKSNVKVDIFETLYKSAAKSAQPHKSLKSSRTKFTAEISKSNLKTNECNKRFAKALKKQQLQMLIEKFDSSQETFEYLTEYMHQKQIQEDHSKIQLIQSVQYRSPFCSNRNVEQKQFIQVGVGRDEHSVQLMKKQISERMRNQLMAILEQERLAKMINQQTEITKSFSKQFDKENIEVNEQSGSVTPQKSKQTTPHEQSFIAKTTNQICSSVKKIITTNMQSLKKIVPKFMKKSAAKIDRFAIFSYGEQYESLFKFQRATNTNLSQRDSQFSFINKIQSQSKARTLIDSEAQTSPYQQLPFQKLNEEVENNNLQCLATSKQTSVTVRDSQVSIQSQEKQDQVDTITETEENGSEHAQTANDDAKKTKKHVGRPAKTKKTINQKALKIKRIAQTRKIAAKLCRQQSRTPLKKRLRNHSKI